MGRVTEEAIDNLMSKFPMDTPSTLLLIFSRKKNELPIEWLHSSDKSRILSALHFFDLVGDTSAVPEIVKLLKSKDPEIIQEAAHLLVNFQDPRAITPLLNALRYDNVQSVIKSEALDTLSLFVNTTPFHQALKSNSNNIKRYAIKVLGKRKDTTAVKPLLALLESSDGKYLIQEIANALGEIGDKRAVPALIKIYPIGDRWDRISIAESMAHFPCSDETINFLGNILKDKDKYVREAAVQSLGELKDERILALLKPALKDDELNVQRSAVEALLKTKNKKAVPILFKAYVDAEGGVLNIQDYIAQYLRQCSNWVIEPLKAGLKHHNRSIRRLSASLLCGFADEGSIPLYIKFLKNKETFIRYSAAEVLGKLKVKEAVKPLTRLLKDKDSDVRGKAAWALGEIGDPSAVKPLEKLIYDESGYDQQEAVHALQKFNDPGTFKIWKDLLSSSDRNMRLCAIDELGELNDTKVIPILLKYFDNEYSTIEEALAKLGEPVVDYVIPLLQDPDSTKRYFTALLLGDIGSEKAVEPLLKALEDSCNSVRAQAAWSLGKIGDTRVFSQLANLLNDPDEEVQRYAFWGLSELKNIPISYIRSMILEKNKGVSLLLNADDMDEALSLLGVLLKNPDRKVRGDAIYVLEKIHNKASLSLLKNALQDRDLHYSALIAISNHRTKEACDILIETALVNMENRTEIFELLTELTGQKFLWNDPIIWKKWWEVNRDSITITKAKQ